MSGFCWDEYEHQKDAKRDQRRHRPDPDYYDRYTTDPCKEVYTETYDRAMRDERRRADEREEEERDEARVIRRHQQEREIEENFQFYEESFPEQEYPEEIQ